MPGSDDRQPASADRPPASRVGDELQQRADEVSGQPSGAEIEQIEQDAFETAQEKNWDQSSTEREGREAAR